MAINIFTGGTSNWGTASNWSLGIVPTATDGHVTTFDASSPDCNQNVSGGVCNAIDFTNYTNTITMNNGIAVSGDITLGSGMTAVGASQLSINTSANITSNGYIWPLQFLFGGTSQTYTLQDDFTVSGFVATGNGNFINDNGTAKILYASGSYTAGAGGTFGTAKIILNGTGTLLSSVPTSSVLYNDFEINTSGTITLGANFRYSTGTFTYTTGTVVTTGNTFIIGTTDATTTLSTDGIVWNNISILNRSTTTLLSDITCSGAFFTQGTPSTLNGYNARITGSLSTAGGSSGSLSGTTTIIFEGSNCSWISGTGTNRLPTIINSSGTMGLSGATIFNGGTLVYSAGTIEASTNVLTITGNATLSLGSGNTWGNFSMPTTSVFTTFTSDVYFAGYFSNGGNNSSYTGLYNMYVGGNFAWGNGTASSTANTLTFILNGTGTWSGAGTCSNNVTINTTGTTTFSSSVAYRTGTLNYSAGTVVTSGSTFRPSGCVLNTNGINWDNVSVTVSGTITLLSPLNVITQFTNTGSLTLNGSFLYLSGILSLGGSLSVVGTTVLEFIGSSPSWIAGTGNLRLNTNINCSTFTLGPSGISNCNFQVGTLTYVSGATITSGSTLDTGTAGSTLDLDGMALDNCIARQGTQTLLSKLTANTLIVCQTSSVAFAGAFGWEVGTFRNAGVNRNITLAAGNTYTVNTSMELIGTSAPAAGQIRLLSSVPSSYAFLNLTPGAACSNRFCNPTDIDSSGGRLVTNVKGTLLRTINWYVTNPDYFAFF